MDYFEYEHESLANGILATLKKLHNLNAVDIVIDACVACLRVDYLEHFSTQHA